MQQLLLNFGVNSKLLIAQVINFGILFYLLKRFAYKPILGMLQKREDIIKKGLEDASNAEKELQNAGHRANEIHIEAKKEAHALLIEAHGEAKDIIEEAKREAIEERHDILNSASKEASDILKAGEEAVSRSAANQIISGITSILGKEMTPEMNSRIISKLTAK